MKTFQNVLMDLMHMTCMDSKVSLDLLTKEMGHIKSVQLIGLYCSFIAIVSKFSSHLDTFKCAKCGVYS